MGGLAIGFVVSWLGPKERFFPRKERSNTEIGVGGCKSGVRNFQKAC